MPFEKLNHKSSFKPKNHQQWFAYYLFEDEDFSRKKEAIIDNLKRLMGEEEYGLLLLLSRKNGISSQLKKRSISRMSKIQKLLVESQSQQPDYKNTPESEIIDAIQELAKQFGVSIGTIEHGLRYRKNITPVGRAPAVYKEDNEVVIRINATMRFEDIKNAYPYIRQLQSKLPGYKLRNRSKAHPDLIFAIYKQRLSGKTFKDIYALYEKNELPRYDGDNRIIGEEALARMYRKFKPVI